MKVIIDGIQVNKKDGECAYPDCNDQIDWKKWDKPPPGWATISVHRYTKKGITTGTVTVCSKHTINFVPRQPTLKERAGKFLRTIIESPYAGNIERNMAFLRAAMRECLLKGEAPYASHAIYTQPGVLRDEDPAERKHGIDAGLAWSEAGQKIVVYTNFGISRGMEYGIKRHQDAGKIVEMRVLDGWPVENQVSVMNEARENEGKK